MAKAFTYSRVPEHQIAVYYDGSDKAGVLIFKRVKAWSQISAYISLLRLPNPTYYQIFLLYILDQRSEWNIVECIVSFLSSILLLFTFPISLFFCMKVSLLFLSMKYCNFKRCIYSTSSKHR